MSVKCSKGTGAKINYAKITKHYSVYKISYSGNGIIFKLYNFLYKDAFIYLDRKQNKFKYLLQD